MKKRWYLYGLTLVATVYVCKMLENSLGCTASEILLISGFVLMAFIFYYIDQAQKTNLGRKFDTNYPFAIILGTLVGVFESFVEHTFK